MNEQWWRSWHGAPMDPKYIVIAKKANVVPGIVSAVIWALLDYASQNCPRGDVSGFDKETFAAFSGFPEESIESVYSALCDKGMITDGKLTNWDKRQPKSEAEIERSRKRRHINEGATDCYVLLQDATKNYTEEIREEENREEEIRKDKESTPDPFSTIQHSLEKTTGIPATQSSMDAIKEIVAMKATVEDIQAGYAWYQKQGKPLKYYGSLVGPTRTAMARRLSEESKWIEPPQKKKLSIEEIKAGEARALARSANV